MKGDLKISPVVIIALALLLALLIFSLLGSIVPGSVNPLKFFIGPVSQEEELGFFDLCIYWSANDFRGTVVFDNKGREHDMTDPCNRALGKPLGSTLSEIEWDQCREQCPAYKRPDEKIS